MSQQDFPPSPRHLLDKFSSGISGTLPGNDAPSLSLPGRVFFKKRRIPHFKSPPSSFGKNIQQRMKKENIRDFLSLVF